MSFHIQNAPVWILGNVPKPKSFFKFQKVVVSCPRPRFRMGKCTCPSATRVPVSTDKSTFKKFSGVVIFPSLLKVLIEQVEPEFSLVQPRSLAKTRARVEFKNSSSSYFVSSTQLAWYTNQVRTKHK